MESKKIYFPVTVVVIWALICFIASCKTTPPPNEATAEEIEEQVFVQTEPEPAPDPAPAPVVITAEYRTATMSDVRVFIEELNTVIRRRNYNSWRAALSDEYFASIASPENLKNISELPAMKTRKVVLSTPQDYFIHVVVPSRADSRVDDIEFLSENRVKVFTVMTNRAGDTQRLRLYDLEKTGNTWKIIN
jgi:hypothetical protein